MGTRCLIRAKLKDMTYSEVYCHFDGYTEGVGAILLSNYNSQEKIEELISYGDMSVLRPDVRNTVFYHRDKGEPLRIRNETNLEKFTENPSDRLQEYEYFWDGYNWEVNFYGSIYENLSNRLERIKIDEELDETVESAMRDILSVVHKPEGSYVQMPLLYPSGSQVVVRVSGGPEAYRVTDFGMGYTEAELMGSENDYVVTSRFISQNFNASFDKNELFLDKVEKKKLSGAIVTIANYTQEAVSVLYPKYLLNK